MNVINQQPKNILPARKSFLLGLVFVMFSVALLCGTFQSHGEGIAGGECSEVIFLANMPFSQDNLFFYTLLIFLSSIVLAVIQKKRVCREKIIYSPFKVFLKLTHFSAKLNDPILKAFRKGIIHPRIYNFSAIIS